jgi:P-type conjugative transfer protein TrbJ
MKRLLLLSLVLVALARPVQAQLVVYDPKQDFNAPFQIGQNILSLIHQALNLLPLDVIVIVDTISTDIATLNTLLQEATQIGMDISSLQAQLNRLFDLHTAPASSAELAQRLAEIQRLIWQARAYAMRVNTLVQTFQNTLRHIDTLIGTIAGLAGAKQGIQVLNQKAATLNYIEMVQTTQLAAFHQSELYERQQQLLVIESIKRIHAVQYSDWPGYQAPTAP